MPTTAQCEATQQADRPQGFSVCSKSGPGPLDGLFKTALGKMLASKDWPQATRNLAKLQEHTLKAAPPESSLPKSRTSPAAVEKKVEPETAAPEKPPKELRLKSEHLPQALNLLAQSGLREDQLKQLAAATSQENGSFDLKELLARVQKMLAGEAAPTGETGTANDGRGHAAEATPAAQLPAVQLAQWQELLIQAGMPAEQVQEFFNAAGQDRDLPLQELTAWLAGEKPAGAPDAAAAKLAELGQDARFQRRLARLTVPKAALPQLQSLLGKAGMAPEALKGLNDLPPDENGGVKWADILTALKTAPAPAESAASLPKPDRQVGLQDLAEWRQLFLDSGLEEAQADELTAALTPGSGKKFLETLSTLTPAATANAAPAAANGSKPEYYVSQRYFETPQRQQSTAFTPGETADPEMGSGQEQNAPFDPGTGSSAGQTPTATFPGMNPAVMPVATPPFAQMMGAAETGGWSVGQTWNAMRGQLQQGILATAQPGTSQLRLALNPPALGELQVQLKLQGDALRATVVTGNPTVAAALNKNLAELQQTLAQHGLNLQQVQVVMASNPLQQQTSANLNYSGQERPGENRGKASGVYRKGPRQTAFRERLSSVNSYA